MTSSQCDSPAGSHCHHPVTTEVPSGVSANASPSSARPGSGVRSRNRAVSPPVRSLHALGLPRAPLRHPSSLSPPAQPISVSCTWSGSTANSLGWSGPRSWSQYRTGADSCKMAVIPASLRSWRSRASSSALLPFPRGGQHRRADHDPAGVPGHLGGRDAAGQRGHHPGLAAGRGKQPQRGDIIPGAGVAVRPGVLPAGIGTLGGEQQRPVGQEPRAALALGGPGQPPGRAALRVDPPDAGQVLLLVGAQRLHGRRQPAPVRRQPQRRHPRYRHEVAQVMERRRCRQRSQ